MFATRVGFYYQAPPGNVDVAMGHYLTPAITVYKWTDSNGWGTKYSNPSVTAGTDGFGSDWHPSGNTLLCSASTGLQAYAWSSTGFGTKYTNAAGVSASWIRGVSFSPNGNTATVANFRSSPYVSAWPWSNATGFGTKYSSPSTLPTSGGFKIIWNNTSSVAFLGSEFTPFLHAWSFSSGWGTKYANATSLPSSSSDGSIMGINPSSTAVSRANGTSPFIWVYTWNNTTGFGTRYSNPSTPVLTSTSYSAQSPYWSSDGSVIFVISMNTAPYLNAYQWSDSTGFGTKYANPSSNPSVISGAGGVISATGGAIIYSIGNVSPYVEGFSWNNSTGWGTKYAAPSTVVPMNPYGLGQQPATKLATT